MAQIMAPYAQWDIPVIGQSYLLFRAKLAAPHSFSPGAESLETELFEPRDIPFDEVQQLYRLMMQAGRLSCRRASRSRRLRLASCKPALCAGLSAALQSAYFYKIQCLPGCLVDVF